MRRRQTIHNHIGDPCIVCALYDMFAALSIAFEDNRGEVPVAPTSLRVALIAYSYDKNICKEVLFTEPFFGSSNCFALFSHCQFLPLHPYIFPHSNAISAG